MAIDVRKLGLEPLTRDEVRDMRSKSQFPKDVAGTHREGLLAFDYLPAEKGKGKKGKDISASFQAKVKILESTAPMMAGRTYTLRFFLGGDNSKYADRDRQAFLAAVSGQTVDAYEAEFESIENDEARNKAINEKYNDTMQQLLDFSEKNGFAPEQGKEPETQFIHTTRTKSKDVAVLKDGKAQVEQATFRQDYFSPLEG